MLQGSRGELAHQPNARAAVDQVQPLARNRLAKRAGLPIAPDPRPLQGFFERSDNIAFAMLGIPAHTISSYGMHTDYHAPSDEVAKIDFPHMARVVEATARLVRLLAEGPKPEWHPGGRPQGTGKSGR